MNRGFVYNRDRSVRKVKAGHNFFTVFCLYYAISWLSVRFLTVTGKRSVRTISTNGAWEIKNFMKGDQTVVTGFNRAAFAAFLLFQAVFITFSGEAVVAKTTIAQSAHLGGNGNSVRFVTVLSKKVPIRVFTLAKPYRVVIDLPEVRFKFPNGQGRKGRGLVSAYRYGLFAKGKSRIVIDVRVPVEVKKAYVETIKGKNLARMVIDLVKTTPNKFASGLSKPPVVQDTPSREPDHTRSIPEPPASKSSTPSVTGGDTRPVVVIAPGHGGVAPGAIGAKGTLEKNVVLKFARVLRKELLETGLFRVEMTRNTDIYIPLHDRVKIGRAKGASLFISIHADSISRRRRRRNSVRGASVYILSEKASDQEARALAALENRSDIIAGVELPDSENPVTGILIDLAQRETNALSAMFARLHIKQMRGRVKLHGYKVRSAGFRVLKAPDTPSVLLELGYLSSIHDEKNLKSMVWQQKMAKLISNSVKQFFNQRVARSPY